MDLSKFLSILDKKALYFDVENAFLSNVALDGKYSITLEITYLDKGTGGWQLYYDAHVFSHLHEYVLKFLLPHHDGENY